MTDNWHVFFFSFKKCAQVKYSLTWELWYNASIIINFSYNTYSNLFRIECINKIVTNILCKPLTLFFTTLVWSSLFTICQRWYADNCCIKTQFDSNNNQKTPKLNWTTLNNVKHEVSQSLLEQVVEKWTWRNSSTEWLILTVVFWIYLC